MTTEADRPVFVVRGIRMTCRSDHLCHKERRAWRIGKPHDRKALLLVIFVDAWNGSLRYYLQLNYW